MADVFSSARSVLRRADRHIDELASEISRSSPDEPYRYIVEKDVDGVRDVHKFKFSEQFSNDIACIMFDAVNNLRACLDQIAFAVAAANGVPDRKRNKFPIAPDAEKFNTELRRLKGVPGKVKSLIESFKPYRSGDDTLWALTCICNVNKHLRLVPVSFGNATLKRSIDETPTRKDCTTENTLGIVAEVRSVGFSISGDVSADNPSWDPDTQELTVAVIGPDDAGASIPMQAEFGYSIEIRHSEELIDGQDPIALLRSMRQKVHQILTDIEAECRVNGLIPKT